LLKNAGFHCGGGVDPWPSVLARTRRCSVGFRAVLLDAGAGRSETRIDSWSFCPRHVSGRLTDTNFRAGQPRPWPPGRMCSRGVAGSRYDAVSLRLGQELEWVLVRGVHRETFSRCSGVSPQLGRFFPAGRRHASGWRQPWWCSATGCGQAAVRGGPGRGGPRGRDCQPIPSRSSAWRRRIFMEGWGGPALSTFGFPITMTTELNDPGEALVRPELPDLAQLWAAARLA